jgi:hypothetical protein
MNASASWSALVVALCGDAVPFAIFYILGKLYGNDIGWQEGAGLLAFLACLGLHLLIEVISVVLMLRAGPEPAARVAAIVCALSLTLSVGFLIYVLILFARHP